MDFRIYVIIDAPLLNQEYEVLIPIDRKVHDIVTLMKKIVSNFNTGYYENKIPCLINKTTGNVYTYNQLIKESDIRTGTRLIMI